MKSLLIAPLSLAISISISMPAFAFVGWTGEWGNWKSAADGTGISVASCQEKTCQIRIATGDPKCRLEGVLATEESEASVKFKTCEVKLSPAGDRLQIKINGDCKKVCATLQPTELSRLNESPYTTAFPWPQCQSESRRVAQTLCTDAKLAEHLQSLTKNEARARELQSKFYVPRDLMLADVPDILKECEAKQDPKSCLETTLPDRASLMAAKASQLKSLKMKHESDLKSTAPAPAARSSLESLKGTYKRKFKSGTSDGDKFEVTDDLKIASEENDLAFDVLLNFFDERECTLNGTAKALKSGRWYYKNKGCGILIFKEGAELVLTDDPPQSCQQHCGKKPGKGTPTFFNARFPLSSRTTK